MGIDILSPHWNHALLCWKEGWERRKEWMLSRVVRCRTQRCTGTTALGMLNQAIGPSRRQQGCSWRTGQRQISKKWMCLDSFLRMLDFWPVLLLGLLVRGLSVNCVWKQPWSCRENPFCKRHQSKGTENRSHFWWILFNFFTYWTVYLVLYTLKLILFWFSLLFGLFSLSFF